jgi:hypothetical protein
MAIGRISGPLLKSNLIRDGVDLAFETDLLYLDVNNGRVGINTAAPQYDLDINGSIYADNLLINDTATLAEIVISSNNITSSNGTITFQDSINSPVVYHAKLIIDDFMIQGNTISTEVSNSSIELIPSGTGIVDIQSSARISGNLTIEGDLNVTGSITIGGNITIGDESTDSIVINAGIASDLIPDVDDRWAIGSPSFRWNNIHVNNFYTTSLNIPELDIGNLIFRNNEITTTAGEDLYLDGNGTGGVRIGNFRITANIITNIEIDAVSVIQQSGTGYFKIDTSNGFVVPVGTSEQRPTEYAVVGMTRYNSDFRALEIWDGFTWISPAGATGAITIPQAEDIAVSFALTLG